MSRETSPRIPKARACEFTLPWTKQELVHVDGKAYVYTGSFPESMIVRFPGGSWDYADVLSNLGHTVEMPQKFRRS